MSAVEIAIVVVVSVAFVAAVTAIVIRKIKYKGGCDCGCEGCPHCGACNGKDKK